ncbi:hypothetical protein NKJ06_21100 [Mesorhizobium sp. M0293]|uniref:hypothetical protein n=1 Tax=Mesorhizobium sp. M0293 TaxID=2956930 RepID=UPI003337A646
MVAALIGLLITILIVGVVAAIIIYCINLLPLDPPFHQIARVIVMLIAVLIVLLRALPLLGVAIPS